MGRAGPGAIPARNPTIGPRFNLVLRRLVGAHHVLLHLIFTRTRALNRFACIIIAFGLVGPQQKACRNLL
jgi:hypothetical protein